MAHSKFLTAETSEQVGEWCDLPVDILTTILYHLFGKDYTNFLSVCRSWRSAPPPLRPIPKPSSLSSTSEASRYPSLFHFSGNSSKCEFYDPFYNGSYVAQIPDELIDARIYFSNYGWLLMCQGSQLFFFQPFTNQRIDLPSIERNFCDEYGRMCFSSPPTSPDCMVFGIVDIVTIGVDISIIRRGEVSWTDIRYDNEEKDVSFYSSPSNPVFYKGAFYCLSIDGKLAVFDPKESGHRYWKIIDKLRHPCDSIQENFLVESNGQLLSICMGSIGKYVWIFRLNHDYEFRWEEIHSLGDKMIFACRTGCISMQTNTMGNTIYFPSYESGGEGLFYSLQSRKFHSLGLPLAREDLYSSKRLLHCAWITPTVSETYKAEELRWLAARESFIPSSGRVRVKGAPSTHPSFVLSNLEDLNHQLFFNMFDSPHETQKMPEVCQMCSAACAFGWLFQVDWDSLNCLLLNPQTMEKIHLPQLPERFDICAISSSPNDPDCIVLLIHYSCSGKTNRMDFIYCRPDKSEWTIVTNEQEEEEEEGLDLERRSGVGISDIIGYDGSIYGLCSKVILVKIDFDPIFKVKFVKRDEVGGDVWLPRPSTLGTLDYRIYMVESCGELLVVRVNFHGEGTEDASKITDVEVFILDINYKKDMGEGGKSG